MARIKLSFPDDVFCFETRMPVRITDINGANHLGNDALISMLSEARAQFLVSYGIQEASKDGTGIIVTDLATMYQSESFFPEMLRFEDRLDLEDGRTRAVLEGHLPAVRVARGGSGAGWLAM